MGFTKLDSGIVDSSIWAEPLATRVVWITILAKSNSVGFVGASYGGLLRASNVTKEEFDMAIKSLESPDPDSRTTDNEGRRIEKINGGWMILNYKKYRELRYNEASGYINPDSVEERIGFVYFAGHKDRVKIGFSNNPWARVNELKTANPDMVLYATLKGSMRIEKELHEEFKHLRIDREWFYLKGKLPEKIKELTGVVLPVATIVATPYASASASASASLSEEKEYEEKPKIPEQLSGTFSAFVEMRKKIRKPLTDRAIELILKKLNDLSCGNYDIQNKILEQSIMNSWQGVFELKENKFNHQKGNIGEF